MGKTKSAAPNKGTKSAKDVQVKSLSTVKDGGVTKPSQTPKAKSQDLAKQVAAKAKGVGKHDKKSKKVAKEPSPEPIHHSDSEEEASSSASSQSSGDESEESGDEDSDDNSEEDSEDDVSAAKPAAKDASKMNGHKSNGVAKVTSQAEADSSDSSSESSDGEDLKPAAPQATPGAKAGLDRKDDSEGSSDDESDEEMKTTGPIDAKALKGKLEKVASKEASSDDESDNGGSSSGTSEDSSEEESEGESEESEEETVAPKKRKAEEQSTPAAKKTKTDDVDDAAKKNLFVGRLSWNVDEEWLTREFEKFGELTRVKVMTERDSGRSKGFGYVEFAHAEDGIKAQAAMHEAEIDGRNINVDFSKPRDMTTPRQERTKQYGDSQPSEASSTLFVANLSFDATNDIVAEEFGKHGSVMGVRLPTDKDTGDMKGFGYVEFATVEEAQKVFGLMSGATISGRPIRLDYSTPRPPRDSGGGFGGGRGGGRGRGGFDRGGRGGGRGRGGFDRGGRGGGRGGRGGSTNRGGFGDFQGKKMNF